MDNLQLFEHKQVRTVWDDDTEKWYFSVVDVVAALTDSVSPTSYWRKLKQRLSEEGNQSVTFCHALKLRAPDGKMRLTDVADTEQLLRLIQSIPSPKAEPTIPLWQRGGCDRQGADGVLVLATDRQRADTENTLSGLRLPPL